MSDVGIISPGSMGRTIAHSVANSGNTVHWTSEGRSQKTVDAARGMSNAVEHSTVKEVFDTCGIVFCIGRGGIAEDTVALAKLYGFKGIYVDGNNLNGIESELNIASIAESAGINYVEALFRGFPLGYDQGGGEDKRNLYLSGLWKSAKIIESLFSDGIWKVEIVAESAKALNRTRFGRLF
jgi:3-hydroxyisobutyrate dehydrogenase-like beta-hydroxyacid dehydrogenase